MLYFVVYFFFPSPARHNQIFEKVKVKWSFARWRDHSMYSYMHGFVLYWIKIVFVFIFYFYSIELQ